MRILRDHSGKNKIHIAAVMSLLRNAASDVNVQDRILNIKNKTAACKQRYLADLTFK